MPPQKYFFDDHKDRLIRAAYSSPDVNRRCGPIKTLERSLGIPRAILLRRARKLGLVPRVARYGKTWSREEEALLMKHSWKSPEVISRHLHKAGFERSATAVQIRMKCALGLSRSEAREDAGVYVLSELARLLGCGHRFLANLIESGELPAQREGERSDGRASQWLIQRKHVRKLVIDYTGSLNFARIDKFWLVDLLTGSSRAKQMND